MGVAQEVGMVPTFSSLLATPPPTHLIVVLGSMDMGAPGAGELMKFSNLIGSQTVTEDQAAVPYPLNLSAYCVLVSCALVLGMQTEVFVMFSKQYKWTHIGRWE